MKAIFSILFLLVTFTCLSQETTPLVNHSNLTMQTMADPEMVSSSSEIENPTDKNKVEINQKKDKKTAQNKLNNLKGKRRGGGMNPVILAIIIIVSAALVIYLVTSSRTTKM